MRKLLFLTLLPGICMSLLSAQDEVYEIFPNLKKWKENRSYEVYVPDNLWDYINGAAESYLAYNFQDLHIVEYKKGKASVRAEVYRHKNPANAYGIYSQERSSDYNFIDIKTQGYLTGTSLNFYKKDYYVKIYSSSDDPSTIAAAKEIAKGISENITGATGIPEAFKQFPEKNQLPYRNQFIAQNFLGHSFLDKAYTADYKKNDENFRLFLIQKETPAECKKILESYFDFTGQDKSLIRQGKITIKDQYNGNLYVKWEGNEIFGVMNTDDEELIRQYLD